MLDQNRPGLYSYKHEAGWQNGYAEDCKSLEVGSIPVPASTELNLSVDSLFDITLV